VTSYLKELFNDKIDPFDFNYFEKNKTNKQFLELIKNKTDQEDFEFNNWAMRGDYLQKIISFDCKNFLINSNFDFMPHLKHAQNVKSSFSSNDNAIKWSEHLIQSFHKDKIDYSQFAPRYELFYYCYCNNEYHYSPKGSNCQLCGKIIEEVNSFCMFNMLDKFSILLSDPQLFKEAKKSNEQTDNHRDGLLFDFFDGKIAELLKNAHVFNLADIVLFGFLFVDEVDCLENEKKKICALMLCILNFDPKKKDLGEIFDCNSILSMQVWSPSFNICSSYCTTSKTVLQKE
jgi:hypothetical protein